MELSNFFTTKNPREVYALTDNAPEWLRDAMMQAHYGGEIMPDDYIYKWAAECAELIDDNRERDLDELYGELEPDVYTNSLLTWINTNYTRMSVVDEAIQEGAQTLSDALMIAQVKEKEMVLSALITAVVENIEEVVGDENE